MISPIIVWVICVLTNGGCQDLSGSRHYDTQEACLAAARERRLVLSTTKLACRPRTDILIQFTFPVEKGERI